MNNTLRERLAAYAHEAWAGWMRYLFGCSSHQTGEDGSITYTIPADKVARWQRQMITPYGELSSDEQRSDLAEADKMIEIFSDQHHYKRDGTLRREPCPTCEYKYTRDGFIHPVELRPSVRAFADEMEKKLHHNAWKDGGVGRDDIAYLVQRLRDEVEELERAISDDDNSAQCVLGEAADVGNFAMFIWLLARRQAKDTDLDTGVVPD